MERNSVQRVIIIPTEGIPEDREKAVVSSIVKDKECFYRYIAFLLGDSYVLSALETANGAEIVGGIILTEQFKYLLFMKKCFKQQRQPRNVSRK